MIEKKSKSRIMFNIFNYGFMIVFSIICIAPIWHVVMASISDPRVLMGTSGLLAKPVGKITMEGYKLVFQNKNILIGYANTLFYVAWSAIIGTALTVLAGYLVSRPNFMLGKPLLLFILFTMMFSGGLIPGYMVNRMLGLINNRLVLMLPGVLNAFYIMMIKSGFEQISSSYEESAKLDGAGPVTILVRILAPLIKANIAVIVMFNIVMVWNSWYPASIYMPGRRDLWPLQLFMREILIENNTTAIVTGAEAASRASFTGNLVKYCVTIVGTLPVLCAYPFAQKYFVTGITLGGVKG